MASPSRENSTVEPNIEPLPPPSPNRSYSRQRPPGLVAAIGLIGAAMGAGAMYLLLSPAKDVQDGGPRARQTGAPIAPREQSKPFGKPITTNEAVASPPPAKTEQTEAGKQPETAPTSPPPATATTKGMQGSIQPPMALEPMKPPLPGDVAGETQLPSDAPAGATLTVLELTPSRSVAQVSAAASKLGGKARAYAISLDSGAAGVLVWVPEKLVPKLIEALGGSAERAARETWSGPPSSRRRKLKEPFEKRLSELELKKQALLVKYLEDAPEVLRVDEDIQAVRQAMAQFELPPASDKMGVVDVRFTGG